MNRKKTGARLEIQVNLHEPLTGDDIVERTEKWVVIDEFSENTSQLLSAAGLITGRGPRPSATPSPTTPVSVSSPTTPSQPEPKKDMSPSQREQSGELEEAEEEFNR